MDHGGLSLGAVIVFVIFTWHINCEDANKSHTIQGHHGIALLCLLSVLYSTPNPVSTRTKPATEIHIATSLVVKLAVLLWATWNFCPKCKTNHVQSNTPSRDFYVLRVTTNSDSQLTSAQYLASLGSAWNLETFTKLGLSVLVKGYLLCSGASWFAVLGDITIEWLGKRQMGDSTYHMIQVHELQFLSALYIVMMGGFAASRWSDSSVLDITEKMHSIGLLRALETFLWTIGIGGALYLVGVLVSVRNNFSIKRSY